MTDGNDLIASTALHGYTGIVIWIGGMSGLSGIASASHALTGAAPQDEIGYGGISTYSNGNHVVASPFWSSGGVPRVGAITLVHGHGHGHGHGPVVDTVNANNRVVGNAQGQGLTLVFDYNPNRELLVVGRPAKNLVTLLNQDHSRTVSTEIREGVLQAGPFNASGGFIALDAVLTNADTFLVPLDFGGS